MAMSLRRSYGGPLAEINVTPMADIMIVLLIIFMVLTPMIGASPVPLPNAINGRTHDEILSVVIARSGEVTVDGTRVSGIASLRALTTERLAAAPGGTVVLLQVDRETQYALVSRAMQALREAGAEEVALAVDRTIGGRRSS
jgi:biopolymer transport protein TolR